MSNSPNQLVLSRSDTRQFDVGATCAISAVAVWAGWLVMMRLALTTRLSTTDLAALSFAVAGLVLFPIVRCAHDDYARLIFLVHKPALPGDRVSGMSSSSHRHS